MDINVLDTCVTISDKVTWSDEYGEDVSDY